MAHLHLAGTLHGFCSDHGELIHLSAEALHAGTRPPGACAVRTRVHVTGDHGCSLLDFLVTPTTPTEAALVTQARPSRWPSSPEARLDAAAPISLLRQAPKLSPPAG